MCYSAIVRTQLRELESLGVISIDSDAYDEYFERAPKKPTPLSERIFPGSFAPVAFQSGQKKIAEVMRYGIFPPDFLKDQKKYDLVFNARRDNLSSKFWADSFMVNHGFIAIRAFFEWVAVKDLLKAGVVKIDEVKAIFDKQAQQRKAKLEEAGKKYKPTPTELKDPRFRQIIIEFKPGTETDLLVPCLFNERIIEGTKVKGFAMLTDDPSKEIRNAGHDRSPIFLDAADIDKWLNPSQHSAEELMDVLSHKKQILFQHGLPKAA